MESTKLMGHEAPVADLLASDDVEWTAQPLRPVAHWVSMPTADGRSQLSMVWETPDPMPPRRP